MPNLFLRKRIKNKVKWMEVSKFMQWLSKWLKQYFSLKMPEKLSLDSNDLIKKNQNDLKNLYEQPLSLTSSTSILLKNLLQNCYFNEDLLKRNKELKHIYQ